MIKTVPFDIPLSFLVGMLIPLACPEGIRLSRRLVLNVYLLGALFWELFFMIPLGAYLYYFYPDWSLMYFYDPAQLTPETREVLGLAALTVYLTACGGGFILAAWLTRSERRHAALAVFLGLAAALGLFSAITFRQLMSIGAYADWIALPRTTTTIISHRVGYIVGLDGTLGGLCLLLAIRAFRIKAAGGREPA